jgi:hypothetical protein
MGQHLAAVDEHYIGEALVHMHKVTDQVKGWLGPIAPRRTPQGQIGMTGRVTLPEPKAATSLTQPPVQSRQ